MVRVYKHFSFAWNSPSLTRHASFSSYPAELSSDDDFYLLSGGKGRGPKLAVLQTTNAVFNNSLYAQLRPQSVLSWQRARIANLIARSGEEWGEVIKQHNSGTGNNQVGGREGAGGGQPPARWLAVTLDPCRFHPSPQWMVVDLERFVPSKDLRPGVLWVVEQMPGLVLASDQTSLLASAGFWSSYNVRAAFLCARWPPWQRHVTLSAPRPPPPPPLPGRSHSTLKFTTRLGTLRSLRNRRRAASSGARLPSRARATSSPPAPRRVRAQEGGGGGTGTRTHTPPQPPRPLGVCLLQIFRRDQAHVKGLSSLKKVMRSNKWPADPVRDVGRGAARPPCAACTTELSRANAPPPDTPPHHHPPCAHCSTLGARRWARSAGGAT